VTTLLKQPDRLYDLLPALYRIADTDQREALGALLKLINEQADALRDGTQQLWDDFFIETCQRWVIPYIGELVGNNPLHDLDRSGDAATAESLFTDLAGPDLHPAGSIHTRADVAKTIHYRRRKGTPSMLEELARDVTGWGAHVVEFFTLLGWNQHLEHLRLSAAGCPDLRKVDVGDRVGGPWDTTTHTVDVRRINEWNGWYNLPHLGFFLWRLDSYRLRRVRPRKIGGVPWRLTFSPLGQNIPLFSAGRREPGESLMADEFTVKAPIRAAAFYEDLATIPKPPTVTATTAYYGDPANPTTDASLVVFSNGVPVNASDVRCANLRNWPSARPKGKKVYVDVTRGRIVLSEDGPSEPITVSHYYGFSSEMGGGEYERRKWLVSPTKPVTGGGQALHAALAARTGTKTVIEIEDDDSYFLRDDITLLQGESLTIQAKNQTRPHIWLGRNPADGTKVATANGAIHIKGGPAASLTLNGLLIEGGVLVDGDLGALRILHTTLVPGRSVELDDATRPSGASIVVAPTSSNNTALEVQIAFSIVGSLRIPPHVKKLWILDSIVDGIDKLGSPPTIAVADSADASGPPAHIERSTLLGTSRFLKLELASESIFTRVVTVDQQQQGCVRFSFVPLTSATPQKYRCQPALQIALEEEKKTGAAKDAVEAEVGQWLAPSFESVDYGRPGFGQLRRTCPVQIRTGAEDGSEMGAFRVLQQSQRESNLRIRLDEYLPVGLEAGIVYVT
jgi:hypothetical protein